MHRYDGGPLQDRKIRIDLWELVGIYTDDFLRLRSIWHTRLHEAGALLLSLGSRTQAKEGSVSLRLV